MRKSIITPLFLLIVSLIAMKSLIHSGFYTSHDGWHIVARLFHFDQGLRDGQLPPRWSGGLLNGFGYPLFLFSYQLPWWLAEPLVLAGVSIFDALKLIFILSYIASGITMYLWVSSLWGRTAGFMSAFIYLITPYRFANILVRANIGEAVSFTFMPLIFWGISRIQQRNIIKLSSIGALGIAGSILSHTMVVLLFSLPLLLYIIVNFVIGKFVGSERKTNLARITTAVVLGLGIPAYYLMPAIYYKPLTVFAERYHGLYKNHFTPLAKLIYSPWGYGALGTAGEMSRQVGFVIWLVTLGVFILLVFKIIRRKFPPKYRLAAVFLISFSWAILMMVKFSEKIWGILEPLSLIDFPWRFLAVTTFSGSVLTGWLVSEVKQRGRQIMLVILLILAATYTNRNHLRVNQYTDIPLFLYIQSELTTNTDDEYLPKWVDRESARAATELLDNRIITISSVTKRSNQLTFAYDSPQLSKTTIHQMYFPGWTAYLDSNELILSKNDKGAVSVDLPAGRHRVELFYQPTSIMRLGELVTLLSLAVTGYLVLVKRLPAIRV